MADTVKLMQGNEACTMGAIAAGLQFFAGYPITPLNGNRGNVRRGTAQAGWEVHSDGR